MDLVKSWFQNLYQKSKFFLLVAVAFSQRLLQRNRNLGTVPTIIQYQAVAFFIFPLLCASVKGVEQIFYDRITVTGCKIDVTACKCARLFWKGHIWDKGRSLNCSYYHFKNKAVIAGISSTLFSCSERKSIAFDQQQGRALLCCHKKGQEMKK